MGDDDDDDKDDYEAMSRTMNLMRATLSLTLTLQQNIP
jgi:hypothetical protein